MRGWLPAPLAGPVTLGDLAHAAQASVLGGVGLDDAAAERVAAALASCAAALHEAPADRPAVALFVPGRIEVFGKHTDYAGGRSLVCAVDRGFSAVAVARSDRRMTVRDVRDGRLADLVIDGDLPPSPGHWTDYVRSVARRLARDFDHATGVDLAFSSDLPQAAGLSTSSALVITLLLAAGATGFLDEDPRWSAVLRDAEDLASYAAAVENGLDFGALRGGGGVGTLGGSQDHCAILCARAGALARFSFAPVRFEGVVALPAGRTFVVASSGVRAEKSAAALRRYNRLAQLAGRAAAAWRERSGRPDPHLGAALEAGQGMALLDALDDPALHERAAQFMEEAGTLVPAAHDALAAGDLVRFGELAARSQHLARTMLHNQVPETNDLVRLAREAGADAASAFGAGFGGSVWALVPRASADAFTGELERAYRARHPARAGAASFFATPAGPPAARIT